MRTRMLSMVVVLLGAAACSGGAGSNAGANGYGGDGSGGGSGYPTSPGPTDPAPTSPNTINANPSLDYNPTALTVAAGTTVTFVFGSVGHSVTFTSAGSPASIPVTMDSSVGVLFPTAGTYDFHCTVHTYMQGTITVQ
jgi:plastocyanin